VVVHYTGWLTNGTKFDSSVDRNDPFDSNSRRPCHRRMGSGLAGMQVGGKRKLTIPPHLGYGERGAAA